MKYSLKLLVYTDESEFVTTNYWRTQGYAAREFANQGLKHGELAIISNEPVCDS